MEGENNQPKIEYSFYQERVQRLEQVLWEIEIDLGNVRQKLDEAKQRFEDAEQDLGIEEKEANRQFLERIKGWIEIEIGKYNGVIAGFEARKREYEQKIGESRNHGQAAQQFLENFNPEKQH